jgi:hypothetical protein
MRERLRLGVVRGAALPLTVWLLVLERRQPAKLMTTTAFSLGPPSAKPTAERARNGKKSGKTSGGRY